MNIYNVIILDESGSMSSIYNETIQSMNEVINGIRKNQEDHPDQHHYVSIITFEGDGIEGVKTRRDRVPIGVVQDFTKRDYRPGGCTPLYDAMGKTLNELESLVLEDDRVFATVITDGYENASHEWNAPAIKALIEECKKDGWVFSFIGASRDILKVAETIAIQNTLLWEKTVQGTEEMFSASGNASSRFFDKIAAPCCAEASVADRKKMRRSYAEQYFDDPEN